MARIGGNGNRGLFPDLSRQQKFSLTRNGKSVLTIDYYFEQAMVKMQWKGFRALEQDAEKPPKLSS
jgi:hypothetical protein